VEISQVGSQYTHMLDTENAVALHTNVPNAERQTGEIDAHKNYFWWL